MNRTRLLLVPTVIGLALLAGCVTPTADPAGPEVEESSAAAAPQGGVTSDGWAVDGDDALEAAGSDVALHECPAGSDADLQNNSVWGTDLYSGDSSVCVAAVHAGVITPDGGVVRVTGAPGEDSYESSTRNGVTTSAWDAWGTSFTVEAP